MPAIDVLIITALKEEYDAVRAVASREGGLGVATWEEEERDTATPPPYLLGKYVAADGLSLIVALARPTRMGGTSTSPVVASLIERLKPRCLAMCGVCAGNPSDVALGDVIIADMVYPYQEGKQKEDAFEGDHRQTPMLDTWVRAAQDLLPVGLPSFGEASTEEAKSWLLERLFVGDDPRKHPARSRYFPRRTWEKEVRVLENEGLVLRSGLHLALTDSGRSFVENIRFYDVEGPVRLPFEIKVGPIASGDVVVKDGVTWDQLKKWGVRSVLGLEMEAAAIGSSARQLGVSSWVVAKGVMDHADPRKDDRYKPFAARASAEVLFKFLIKQLATPDAKARRVQPTLVKSVYVIGGVTGETAYPSFEAAELGHLCAKLGEVIAQAGADLIVCSPFEDSADIHTVKGYSQSGVGGTVHFHSPRHQSIVAKRAELQAMLGESGTKIQDWYYPGPEDDESWGQAWLLCQLRALECADVVVAVGGRLSKTANTLLHIAEARRIPVVPFAFFGGASRRAYERQDWQRLHPGLDSNLLMSKQGIGEAMRIADRLVTDRIKGIHSGKRPPLTFFISRANSDGGYADELATYLEHSGRTPRLGDRTIRADRMVQPSIEEAILKSDVCIVLWSKAYAISRWCYDELDFALDREGVGEIQIWLFNLDGSDIVPGRARRFPQAVVRTPQALIEAVRKLLDPIA